MLALLFLLAAQSAPESGAQELDRLISAAKVVQNQTLDCMDAQIKLQQKAHVEETPENIASMSLEDCLYLKEKYSEALVKSNAYISQDAANRLADSWFYGLKPVYAKHVSEFDSRVEISELRMKYITALWGRCASDKGKEWSALSDSADVISQASVTYCGKFKNSFESALNYYLTAHGMDGTYKTQLIEKIESEVKKTAAEAIIEERAKRLLKK